MQNDIKTIIDTVHDLASIGPINGFMTDDCGNQIRVKNIKAQDLLRDELVKKMAQEAAVIADELQALKQRLSQNFERYIQQLEEEYKVKVGGKKGNVQLVSFDKRLKVERTKQDRHTTNEHMLVAMELVDQCLSGWSKGSNRNLQAFVRKYFRVDARGNFNIADLQRVKKLQLETPDPLWDKAMQALDNAIEHDTTATYFRAFFRDEAGHYRPIPLDIAKI